MTMTGSPERDNCVIALQPLANGRLLEFNGLAAKCSLAALSAEWAPLDDWQGAGFLGERQLSRQFLYLALGGLSKAARVWFDEELVTLVDLADPALNWADVLALGDPAARFDTRWKGTAIPEGEWVYPQRGLSLHVRPAAGRCFHLVAFAPTTLREFLTDSRLIFDLTLRPGRLEDE
jgi:hypothetical protein